MKHYYTRTLMLLLALTWLVPKANAQAEETLTEQWRQAHTSGNGFWLQGAATLDGYGNETVYTVPAIQSLSTTTTTNTAQYFILFDGIYYTKGWSIRNGSVNFFSSGSGSAAFPVGSGSAYEYGPGIAADAAGTLWIPSIRCAATTDAVLSWANGIKSVAYYTVRPQYRSSGQDDAGTKSGINLSSYGIGRSDLMSAYGDGINANGVLWFCDETNKKVVGVKLSKGSVSQVIKFNAPVTVGNRALAVQYSDTEIMYNCGRDGTTIYKGIINWNSSSISWTNLNITTYRNNGTAGSAGATMFRLAGNEYVAYSSSSSQITIKNITTGNSIVKSPGFTSASSYINHNINAIIKNGNTADIFVYVPGASGGAVKYTLTVTQKDPVQNLAVKIVKDQDPTQLSRQDAVLTWEAPAKGTVSKYTIYCRENPWFSMEGNGVDSDKDGYSDGPQWRQDTWSAWKAIGTTTELTFTDIDVCMYASSISRSYQYKVVPTFSTGTIGAESNVIEITPEFVPFVPIWDTSMDQDDIKLGIDRYDGYCKVQLYWTFPQVNNYDYFPSGQKSVYGVKPDYYSILRNGKEIATNITCYNYIDTDVKSEQTYTYEVVSHYYDFPNETAVSSPNTVYVAKRDWAKVGYELTEIYNYKIASSGSNVHIPASSYATIVTNHHAYYQGAFHNGYWYIIQANDGTTSTTSGGIIKISAADPKENANNNILKAGTKIKSFSNGRSNGIASDDEGNLFVQSSTFGSRLKTGTIYFNDGNNNYGNGYTVDLSGIDLTEYNEVNPAKYLTTAAGRVDYYSMKGNLRTKGEAYLYLAPSISRAVYVIKLTYNGSKVTATLHNKFQDADGRRRSNNEPFLQNNENIAIPVRCAGRENEFLHLIRSSALSLWACHDDADQKAGRITNVYDTQARVNTPGGCTLEFNGELFLITPTSQYSVNKGNFYIGMAERKTADDTPATADFSHIIPVIMYNQADAEDGGGTASGTVSIYAEVGKEDVNGDGILNDYADIYMYAPQGLRFAKYRLTPSTGFPPSQVTLDIAPVYAEEYDASAHNPGGNIERFDATATWPQVTDYGVTTENGNIFYKIQSYTLQFVDANGNAITEKDANGNLRYPAIEFDVDDNDVPTKVYTVTFDANGTKIKSAVSADSEIYKNLSYITTSEGVKIYSYVFKDVKKDVDYTSLVTVNYIGNDNSNQGVQQKSPKTEYESSNSYEAVEATGTVLVNIKRDNWGDWDADHQGNPASGTKDPDDAYYDSYRVCLKLTNPDFGTDKEYPRSYYTIGIDKDKNGTIDQEISEFKLFYGEQSTVKTLADESATTPIVDKDGYVAITDGKIPGDYDFEIETAGKPHVFWDMLDYTEGYDDNVNYTDTNNPSTWDYIVTTAYAANNARIMETPMSAMATDNGGITTGVEVISTQAVLNVYPIPATISVTIKCSEEIKDIEIYSESGMLVSSMSGNGEQVMTVNVSNLASGYYFMRVNNLAPVKIIKN